MGPTGATLLHMSCTATNSVLRHHVTDQKQVALKFAPEAVSVSGPSTVLSGSAVSLECVSAPSVPAAALTWSVSQAGERLQFSPDENVEQLEDGSFQTISILEVVAGKGHDLVVECYGTNEVMGSDFHAFAHVIDILSPPGIPEISGVSPNTVVQNLTCSTSAGNPPASLSWYKGQEMMDSHYQVEGDMVTAHITFVPSEYNVEVTCEASNEALSEPFRNSLVIGSNSESSTFETLRVKENDETVYEYYHNEDDYLEDYIYEHNVTDAAIEHEEDAVANEESVNIQNSESDPDANVNYSENEIADTEPVHDKQSETNLEDNTVENVSDTVEDHSETSTDAVYVKTQKQVSITQSIKTGVKVPEETTTKNEDKTSSTNQQNASILSLCLVVLVTLVTSS